MIKKGNFFGKDWLQIVAILLGSLVAFICGTFFAWSSPYIPKIVNDTVTYDISFEEASYFTVLPPIAAILFTPIFAKLSDTIGRKRTLLFVALPQLLAMLLKAVAKSVYVFYAARFITGLSDACIFSCLPMYIGEIATPKVRGTWGNLMSILIYGGQLSINIAGSYVSVTTASEIFFIFPIIFLVLFAFMPESPYYYIMKGRTDDAKTSLQRLRREQNVEEELATLQSDVKRQMSETGSWKDLFIISTNRKALLAGVFLRGSQQLGGFSSIAVYTQLIFLQAGGDMSASHSAILVTALCTVLSVFAGLVVDKFGRQKSFFFSVLFSAIALSCLAFYFYIDEYYPEIHINVFNWIPLVGMISYITFYSFGVGILPNLMLSELFSTTIKAKGLLFLNITFGLCVASITKIFHWLDSSFGLYAPFLLFAVSSFVSASFTFYFVPETKGKTLEEIQQMLRNGKKKDNVESGK